MIVQSSHNFAAALSKMPGIEKRVHQAIIAAHDLLNQDSTTIIKDTVIGLDQYGPITPGKLRKVSTGLFMASDPVRAKVVSAGTVQSAIGSSVFYARIHEFGGTFSVKAHTRTTRRFSGKGATFGTAAAKDKNLLTKRGNLRKGAAKKYTEIAGNTHDVRAHDVIFPARAMFGTVLKARKDIYKDAIEAAIVNTVNESMKNG